MIEFRHSAPDAGKVLQLFNKAGIGKPNWTESRLETAIKESGEVISAFDQNNLVGFISLITDRAWVAYITQLAVDPDYQNQGIGKSLISKAKNLLGEGVTIIVHSSQDAKKFYEASGFESYPDVYKQSRTT